MKSNPDFAPPLGEFAFTPADLEAMKHSADQTSRISGKEYLAFLARASAHLAPSRRTSAGWEPFDLRNSGHSRR